MITLDTINCPKQKFNDFDRMQSVTDIYMNKIPFHSNCYKFISLMHVPKYKRDGKIK